MFYHNTEKFQLKAIQRRTSWVGKAKLKTWSQFETLLVHKEASDMKIQWELGFVLINPIWVLRFIRKSWNLYIYLCLLQFHSFLTTLALLSPQYPFFFSIIFSIFSIFIFIFFKEREETTKTVLVVKRVHLWCANLLPLLVINETESKSRRDIVKKEFALLWLLYCLLSFYLFQFILLCYCFSFNPLMVYLSSYRRRNVAEGPSFGEHQPFHPEPRYQFLQLLIIC